MRFDRLTTKGAPGFNTPALIARVVPASQHESVAVIKLRRLKRFEPVVAKATPPLKAVRSAVPVARFDASQKERSG